VNLYRVQDCGDLDMQLLVIAATRSRALTLAHQAWPFPHVHRKDLRAAVAMRGAEREAELVLWSCHGAEWTCPAWAHELCEDCAKRERSE
jgi:hypothetical protein